jgi:hypothetical protein
MNKLMLMFCSFIAGSCWTFFLLASTKVHAGQIVMQGREPQIQAIGFFGNGDTLKASYQQLDSFSCNRCIMNVPLLTYAGGAVKLSNCKLPPKTVIELRGAALNTLRVIEAAGYVIPQVKPGTVEFKHPNIVTVDATEGLNQ